MRGHAIANGRSYARTAELTRCLPLASRNRAGKKGKPFPGRRGAYLTAPRFCAAPGRVQNKSTNVLIRSSKMKTVVAVDVGAGNTNVIAAKDGQVFSSFMFPSGVGLDAHGALSSFHRGLERKYEVCPKIDGTIFRVSLRPNQQVPDYS